MTSKFDYIREFKIYIWNKFNKSQGTRTFRQKNWCSKIWCKCTVMDSRAILYSKSYLTQKIDSGVHMCWPRKPRAYWISAHPALCGMMRSRVKCPYTTQATPPSYPIYFRLSLLTALERDGPGWSTLRRFAQPNLWFSDVGWCMWTLPFFIVLVLFSCGTPPKYIAYLVLIVVLFLGQ